MVMTIWVYFLNGYDNTPNHNSICDKMTKDVYVQWSYTKSFWKTDFWTKKLDEILQIILSENKT